MIRVTWWLLNNKMSIALSTTRSMSMKRKVTDFDDFINLCNISKENANNHDEKLPKAIQTNKWKLLVMMVNTKGSFDCALPQFPRNGSKAPSCNHINSAFSENGTCASC